MSGAARPLVVVELPGPITARAGRFLALQGHEVVRVVTDRRPPEPGVGVWDLGKSTLAAPGGELADEELDAALRRADAALVGDQSGDIPERLQRRFPGLDIVCLTPWGRTGPDAGRPASDHTIAAAGGWTAQIGHPGEPPLTPPGEQAWALTGVAGAFAVHLGALRHARRSGRGTVFDIAALEVVAATLEVGALTWLHERRGAPRPGRRHPLVPHELLRARDGWVAAGLGGNDSMWQRLSRWLAEQGEAGLHDARFADADSRIAARHSIFEVLARFCADRRRVELWHEAQHRRLPWAAVLQPAEVVASPQLAWRGFFRHEKLDDVGDVLVPGLPATVTRNERRSGSGRSPTAPARGVGTGSLSGVRVLDLTWVLAGPFATRLLADHGADVVKVESAHRPDPTRWSTAMHLGPGPVDDPETSGYFANHNRNKRSITLNLRRPEALEALRRLIASADVVVDNYAAGTLARWGLDRAALWRIRDDLIIAELSGTGQTGPWSHFVSYADAVSALSGLTALTVDQRGDAVGVVFGLADLIAGYHGALAIVDALQQRSSTGEGAYLDLSQLEAVACNLTASLVHRPDGSLVAGPVPTTADLVLRCAGEDSWCAVSLPVDPTERGIRLRRLTIGHRHAGGPRHGRGQAWLARVAAGCTPDELADALCRVGIPAAVVADGRRLVEQQQQLAARHFYLPVVHPVAGSSVVEGDPVLVDGRRPPVRLPAPLLGQDTAEVLSSLGGYDDAQLERLATAGATS